MLVTKGGFFGWRFQQQKKQRAQAQHATRIRTPAPTEIMMTQGSTLEQVPSL
jgi:hypothetical protein